MRKQRFMSNMFLRNMLADLGKRSAVSTTNGTFTPYFQYKIGNYQPDYYLYFPKEPFATRYKNEVFNKLQEYSGYDLVQYLEFHFNAYPDKTDFLRFLRYEIAERLMRKPRPSLKQRMQRSLQWVLEKGQEMQREQPTGVTEQRDNPKTTSYLQNHEDASPNPIEGAAQLISQRLTGYLDKILAGTEERLETMTHSYITGHIELNNHQHMEKVIQLFFLLQTVQAPPKIGRAEQLFKKFSAIDIASILHLHFDVFKGKQINTLQVKIREATERLHPNHPKVQKVVAALQDFFY